MPWQCSGNGPDRERHSLRGARVARDAGTFDGSLRRQYVVRAPDWTGWSRHGSGRGDRHPVARAGAAQGTDPGRHPPHPPPHGPHPGPRILRATLPSADGGPHLGTGRAPRRASARRLARYLSPPFFPVHPPRSALRTQLHHVRAGPVPIGPFHVSARARVPPGTDGRLPRRDAERFARLPARSRARPWSTTIPHRAGLDLGLRPDPRASTCCSTTPSTRARNIRATSAGGTARSMTQLAFARLAGVKHLVPFHHDPGRDDDALEAAIEGAVRDMRPTSR